MPSFSFEENIILNSVSDGITVNTQNDFLYVNTTFAKMIGYSVSEVLGMNILEIVAPKFVELVDEQTRKRQQRLEVDSIYELELVRRDGIHVPVEFSVSRIDFDGKSSSLTIIRNISERKQAGKALVESEERYRTLFHNSGEASFIHHIGNNFIEVNTACSDLLGYSKDELLTMTPHDIGAEDNILSDEELMVLIRQKGNVTRELRFVSKQGKIIEVELVSQFIQYQGRDAVLSVARDITDRKKLEREIEYIARFPEENTNPVLRIDKEGIIIYSNKASESFLDEINIQRGDLIPENWWRLISEVIDTGIKSTVDISLGERTFSFVFVPVVGETYINAYGLDISGRKKVEDELRKSEVLFRGFMQSATERYNMFDKDMCYIEVNNSWLQQTGFEREDVIGKHVLEVFPELKETGRYEAYLKVLETGEPIEFNAIETVVGRGGIVDISVFKAGDVLGIVARDVTERVMYQRRLEALHSHAVALGSAETIDKVADMTRDSLNEVIGFHLGSLDLVESEYLIQRHIWGADTSEPFTLPLSGPGITVKAVNTGKTLNIGDVRDNPSFNDRFVNLKTVSELAVPVIESGKAVGVINLESEKRDAFSEDDQRLVETLALHVASALSRLEYLEKIRASEVRLSALHQHSLSLNLAESTQEVVTKTLEIMGQTLGFDNGSIGVVKGNELVFIGIIGVPTHGLRYPLDGSGLTVKAVNEARIILVGDVRSDPDYIRGFVDSLSELDVPIIAEDTVLGVLNSESTLLNFFTDDDTRLMEVLAQNVGVTLTRLHAAEDKIELERQVLVQQVQVEQEQELAQLKTRFMSTATHELRTPLTSIQGYIELIQMEERGLSETQCQYFKVIQRNVRRLTKLTDDLVDQQRLEEERITLNLERVKTMDLVEEVRSEFKPILEEKHQTLEVNCVDVVVSLDRLRVMQVLVNLLSNASKFSPEGAEIVVDVVETGDGVQFSVSDRGVGIREEDMDKLFTPFPGILVEGNVWGTGLGLSISKGIVELHEGRIWAESDGFGTGTTFIFTIPYRK